MKFYIATRFDNWREAKNLAFLLRGRGHEVCANWIAIAEQLDGVCSKVTDTEEQKVNALLDLDDIDECDAIAVIIPREGGTGMWFEAGYAYNRAVLFNEFAADGEEPIRCFAIGEGRTIFMRLFECFETYPEFLAAIR